MAIFASTTLGTGDPSRAMSIKALEARAQALAAAQSKQELPASVPSPWQGAGYLANTVADAVTARRADQAVAARRQDLANIMGGIGSEGPNPQQLAGVTSADPDIGKMYAQQAFTARQSAEELAARKEAAAQKAQADREYLAEQDRLQQAHPQSDIGKLTADVGRKPTEVEIAAEIRKKTMPSPADQAAIGQAKDENINLQTTAAQLAEAQQLLDKGIYHGSLAAGRTEYGQSVPSVLQGITGTDPETTARSKRYNQIMSTEVVARLKSLKGPASNKDMEWATSTVNDASAPKENKVQALKILRAQMDAHLRSSEETLKGMGGVPVKVDIPAAGATAAPAAGGGDANAAARAWLAANPNDPRAAAVRQKLGGQ
jgi:hypothetical protein